MRGLVTAKGPTSFIPRCDESCPINVSLDGYDASKLGPGPVGEVDGEGVAVCVGSALTEESSVGLNVVEQADSARVAARMATTPVRWRIN